MALFAILGTRKDASLVIDILFPNITPAVSLTTHCLQLAVY